MQLFRRIFLDDMIPRRELEYRWNRCRSLLKKNSPGSEGFLIFSRLNIYYLSGAFINGLLWLPPENEPVLFCRRGIEKAKRESHLKNIVAFNSYADVPGILNHFNLTLPKKFSVEMNGLSWTLSKSLNKHLTGHEFISGDKIIMMSRSKKSEWELKLLRETGSRHAKCMTELLPPLLHQGMNELEISHKLFGLFLSEGHHGILRMETSGEELFFGYVSVGESANYPSAFNGPVGIRGIHPSIPYMGSDKIKWGSGQPLTIDTGFNYKGYTTDKTQIYWAGKENTLPNKIRDAHNFCIEIQAIISDMLHPGVLPSDIRNNCFEKVKNSQWLEGFMGLGENKVSFIGHGIGLSIDEYPVIAEGFDLPLEEGMVLAIEPKIGIAGIGMVGVENTFEVTKTGGKCLTGDDYSIICI
jgi:Xaa-Pro dipeptidase